MKPSTVLIVDDSRVSRMLTRQHIQVRHADWVVEEAANGAEAVDLINRLLPDIVLLDIAMPGINGLEVLREVTKSLKVRVIILTAYETEEHAVYALRAGASGFLPRAL